VFHLSKFLSAKILSLPYRIESTSRPGLVQTNFLNLEQFRRESRYIW